MQTDRGGLKYGPQAASGPLKHSTLLASVGILYRRENTFSKGWGSLPCTEHWITFSLSYSSQGHMSSTHCAAGDLTVLPVSFSTVVTYTSRINEYGEDRQYLSHHAISTTFTGQRAYCLGRTFTVETCNLSYGVYPMHLNRQRRILPPLGIPDWFADADSS